MRRDVSRKIADLGQKIAQMGFIDLTTYNSLLNSRSGLFHITKWVKYCINQIPGVILSSAFINI